eukprot:CAMPEP_0114975856 /NCGR_PEP_ID=MMETSP0216-20121206/2340_1 /TAXON_ID=223996 /ORGANISM="Protocruzia adherens, Strain Boccale" /LENGTH=282 /DNA_ID=CAMNT_0002336701 /DNA_START=476 /DNA_END=1324 /DNA_ORIENTATION=+
MVFYPLIQQDPDWINDKTVTCRKLAEKIVYDYKSPVCYAVRSSPGLSSPSSKDRPCFTKGSYHYINRYEVKYRDQILYGVGCTSFNKRSSIITEAADGQYVFEYSSFGSYLLTPHWHCSCDPERGDECDQKKMDSDQCIIRFQGSESSSDNKNIGYPKSSDQSYLEVIQYTDSAYYDEEGYWLNIALAFSVGFLLLYATMRLGLHLWTFKRLARHREHYYLKKSEWDRENGRIPEYMEGYILVYRFGCNRVIHNISPSIAKEICFYLDPLSENVTNAIESPH